MDSPSDTTPVSDFRTPARILIPKLVCSRDKWKAKATARKRQYHKERIRSRDLVLSRQRWRGRALTAEAELQHLRQQLQCATAEAALLRAQLAQPQEDSKKS